MSNAVCKMARIQRREHISLARDENKFPEEHSGLASGIRHSGGRGGRDSDGTMKRDLLHKLSLFLR